MGNQETKRTVRMIKLASLEQIRLSAATQPARKSHPSPDTAKRREKQSKRDEAPGPNSDSRDKPRGGRRSRGTQADDRGRNAGPFAPRENLLTTTVTVSVPLSVAPRGGRKIIISPAPVEYKTASSAPDNALLKALAKAHRWRRLIENGHYASVTELGRTEKVNQSYACRVLRLTLLAPNIVEAILDGSQAKELHLKAALKPLPVEWEKQGRLFRMAS